MVDTFLALGGERQIVSLGAGTDTRAFRLRARGEGVRYHEFDFPDICAAKRSRVDDGTIARLIGSKDSLQEYYIHPLDLRTLGGKVVTDFEGLREDIPTLVISECCLCYLQIGKAEEVIRWFTLNIKASGIILYEPIRVDDPFGQRMVENLAARGVVMPTVQRYKTLEDQQDRLLGSGFGKLTRNSLDQSDTIATENHSLLTSVHGSGSE